MQIFLIKRELIEILKNLVSLCKDPESSKCIIKTNSRKIEILFSTTRDRNCMVEFFISINLLLSIDLKYMDKCGFSYVSEEIYKHVNLNTLIFSNRISELKEFINIVEEEDQLWFLKVNANGSREISVSYEKFFYNSSLNYELAFNNCIVEEDSDWLGIKNPAEFESILQAHYLISNTNYNRVIGSHSSISIKKDEPWFFITSTNGRIMINSKVHLEEPSKSCDNFKIILPKSIKKISAIVNKNNKDDIDQKDNLEDKIDKDNIFISIKDKRIILKNNNCEVSLMKNSPKDQGVIKSLCEFDEFKDSLEISLRDLNSISKFCKTIKQNISDINEIEICIQADSNNISIKCRKKNTLIEKKILVTNNITKDVSMKTGQDIFAFIGGMLDNLIKDKEENNIIVDYDNEVPYARIRVPSVETNIFFIILNNS